MLAQAHGSAGTLPVVAPRWCSTRTPVTTADDHSSQLGDPNASGIATVAIVIKTAIAPEGTSHRVRPCE